MINKKNTENLKLEFEKIRLEIKNTREMLNDAEETLELLTENDMIDSYTYYIKSLEMKYEHLLKKIKDIQKN